MRNEIRKRLFMTLTQFKYVLEVEKMGSINHAANNLFVSQSVLSTSIKKDRKSVV